MYNLDLFLKAPSIRLVWCSG